MPEGNFRESPKGEVRRILIPRTPVNKGKKSREAEVSLVDQGEAVALAAAIVVDVVVVLEIFRARSSELRNAV
jgi:hypothetical protein